MPFVVPALEQGILGMITNPPKNAREAAQRLARAYADYARPVVGAGSPAAFTGTEANRMALAMASYFITPGAPPSSIQGIVLGVQSFWLAPPVAFGPAITTIWGGQPLLQGILSSFTNPKISAGSAAKRLARALDSATRLVFVQPPGPVPPVPVA